MHEYVVLVLAVVTCCSAVTTKIAPDQDAESVKRAFDNVNPGDILEFTSGQFSAACNLSVAASNVTIRGAGKEYTVLDCNDGSRHFFVSGANVSFQDMHLTHGFDESGGGCVVFEGTQSSLLNFKLTKCKSANRGGSLLVGVGGTLTAEGVEISQCEAELGGAVFIQQNASFIARGAGSISANTAVDGGAVYGASGSRILLDKNVRIENNRADTHGGAMFVFGAHVDIKGDVLIANNTAFLGGGVAAHGGSLVVISGQTRWIANVATLMAGALHCQSSDVVVREAVVFSSNEAMLAGGAMQITECTLTAAEHVTFESNWADFGGAIALLFAEMVAGDQVQLLGNGAVLGGAVDQGTLSSVVLTGAVRVADNYAFYIGCAYLASLSPAIPFRPYSLSISLPLLARSLTRMHLHCLLDCPARSPIRGDRWHHKVTWFENAGARCDWCSAVRSLFKGLRS